MGTSDNYIALDGVIKACMERTCVLIKVDLSMNHHQKAPKFGFFKLTQLNQEFTELNQQTAQPERNSLRQP